MNKAIELDEQALDMVNGAGFGDWLSDAWETVKDTGEKVLKIITRPMPILF
jgi:hypothetical protein